jgi:hypothetical protein|eukprot:COSAG02_NODE_1108_length_14539_cov_4.353393_6_plen_56_part_00
MAVRVRFNAAMILQYKVESESQIPSADGIAAAPLCSADDPGLATIVAPSERATLC